LERTFTKPFKLVSAEACTSWRRGNPGLRISEYDISSLDNGTFVTICIIVLVRNEFSYTEVYPLNRNFVSDTDFIPSQ
jgi:hypothetical protein